MQFCQHAHPWGAHAQHIQSIRASSDQTCWLLLSVLSALQSVLPALAQSRRPAKSDVTLVPVASITRALALLSAPSAAALPVQSAGCLLAALALQPVKCHRCVTGVTLRCRWGNTMAARLRMRWQWRHYHLRHVALALTGQRR
jgi:hypothetical protein